MRSVGGGVHGLKLDVAMAIGCADTPFAAHLLPAANTVRLPAIGCADTPDIIILYCKRGISDDVDIQL